MRILFSATVVLSVAISASASTFADTAALLDNSEKVVAAFDTCLKLNSKTEFDRPSDIVARVEASCVFSGASRFKARGDSIYGDVLAFNADKQAVTWPLPLDRSSDDMTGTMVSPYNLLDAPTARKELPSEDREILDTLGDSDFLLLEIANNKSGEAKSYAASNAYGATTQVMQVRQTVYSLAVLLGDSAFGKIKLLDTTLSSEQARELMPNLDIEVDWTAQSPCRVCYRGGSVERGTLGLPTFTNPYDIKIEHRYVYAHIDRIRLIDRRSNTIVADTIPKLR